MIADDMCSAQWLSDQLCCSSQSSVSDVLVLDCRSADEYSAAHVSGSLLVVVPSIMLRRLRTGSASVAAVVSDASARRLFAERSTSSHVVLYDAGGDGASDSVVEVLMSRLKQDGCCVSYLTGGFKSFRRQFSHLCVYRHPTATAAAADSGDGIHGVVSASRHLLCVDDDVSTSDICSGLSNLRLSSSAPSSSYLGSSNCASPVRPRQRHPVCDDQSSRTCTSVAGGSGLPFPVRVLDNLYLGDAATARDLDCLRRHNIQYIVNVTADVENAFEDNSTLMYMRIAITDHWSETPTSFFTGAINFIEEGRQKNVGVLVHCLAGISRSVTVTVAYLMFSLCLSLEDAYEYLRRVRPTISPNFNFMGQLADFDQTLKYARQHCTCLSAAAPQLKLCENCRRQVTTYFTSPPAVTSTTAAATSDDVSTMTMSASSSPFSISSMTSSTSTHSLPSPAVK